MAEHDERNFEHELSERLKMLDANIKIPEIPDAQSIFEKADAKKSNIVPFKKHSRYIAAAAAVVLICIGVPVMAQVLSGGIGMKNMDARESDSNYYYIFDSFAEADDAAKAVAEQEIEPEEARLETDGDSSTVCSSGDVAEEVEAFFGTTAEAVREALYNFFWTDLEKIPSSGSSSSDFRIESGDEMKENSTNGSLTEKPVYGDDVSFIEDYINKKRSVEITVEKDSVSVLLRDNSAEEEMIAAFWIEGTYQGSYIDGNYYIVELEKEVDPDEIEQGHYLPMVGDAYGTYYISEEDIFVPDEITKGAIALAIEINVGTGEYRIYASLV